MCANVGLCPCVCPPPADRAFDRDRFFGPECHYIQIKGRNVGFLMHSNINWSLHEKMTSVLTGTHLSLRQCGFWDERWKESSIRPAFHQDNLRTLVPVYKLAKRGIRKIKDKLNVVVAAVRVYSGTSNYNQTGFLCNIILETWKDCNGKDDWWLQGIVYNMTAVTFCKSTGVYDWQKIIIEWLVLKLPFFDCAFH